MLSRSKSQVFSRNGSIERSSVSRLGYRGGCGVLAESVREDSVGGKERESAGGALGSWCRYEVRRCELCTTRGSSTRMS